MMISRVRGVIILMAVLLIASYSLKGQDKFNDVIYQSYISGEIAEWNKLLDRYPAPKYDTQKQYDYILAHYGLIGYCVWADKRKEGKKYHKIAMALVDDLLETNENDPRFRSLKGALYGLQLGLNRVMAPIIGRKALKQINIALEIDPNSPQALVENANKDWHMPSFMGGSHTKAIAGFEKAIRLMEKDKEFISKNWYYLNVLVTLAKWYEEEGRISQGKRIRRKILEIEPDFKWPKG